MFPLIVDRDSDGELTSGNQRVGLGHAVQQQVLVRANVMASTNRQRRRSTEGSLVLGRHPDKSEALYGTPSMDWRVTPNQQLN